MKNIYKYIEEFIYKTINHSVKTNGYTDSNSHFITLFSIAVSIRAKNILEIGCRSGGTTLPLLCAYSCTDGILHFVDISDMNFKCSNDLLKYWKFIKSDSLSYLNNLDSDCIYDLIYIDDRHSYRHVSNEIDLIKKHVNKRSIILLNDLMANTDPDYDLKSMSYDENHQFGEGGPYRAVSEINSDIWEFSTIQFVMD